MKNFFKITLTSAVSLIAVLCICFAGCSLLNDSDILSVRRQADKLCEKIAETLGEGFKNRDAGAIKELFCPLTKQLPGIDGQIAQSFDFVDGNVISYETGERGYESYGAEYGDVTDYEFDATMRLTAESGKKYGLTFRVKYIADEAIRGMTAYSVSELYTDDYKYCTAGYYWNSPYDGESGILTAKLITFLSDGNADGISGLMCRQIADNPETDGQIRLAIAAFDGAPLFDVRTDGLYNASTSENDFSFRILASRISKDSDGNISGIWLRIYASHIVTDAGKTYDLDTVLFLQNDGAPQLTGISCFSLYDSPTNERLVLVGEWID